MDNRATAGLAIIFGECLADVFGPTEVPGGAPYNVARHLAGLGLAPAFVSRVGKDALGQRLAAELRNLGPCHNFIQQDAVLPTGRVTVHADPAGHRFEILRDQAYDHIAWPAELPAHVARTSTTLPWLYFGTLAQRSATNRATLERLRREIPHACFVDLNWREGQLAPSLAQAALDQADELKLSSEELNLMLGWAGLGTHGERPPAPCAQPALPVQALLQGRRVRQLIVTYGAQGYALWNAGGVCEISGAAAPVAQLVDTVGAGDAFSAITLAGLLVGWPRATSLERASAFAAAICGIRGALPAEGGFYAPWRERWGLPDVGRRW